MFSYLFRFKVADKNLLRLRCLTCKFPHFMQFGALQMKINPYEYHYRDNPLRHALHAHHAHHAMLPLDDGVAWGPKDSASPSMTASMILSPFVLYFWQNLECVPSVHNNKGHLKLE